MNTPESNKQITFNVKGIELIDFQLNRLKQPLEVENTFGFDINLERHVIPDQKLIIILIKIAININNDKENTCASMSVSCIFEVENLHEFLSGDSQQVLFPEVILTTFNSISLSTVRGMLFSELRGTYLHHAILPIVDPKQFAKDSI